MERAYDQRILEERIRESVAYRMYPADRISAMLDFEFESCSLEEAEGTLSHIVRDAELNVYETLHGGIITWLMDTTMGIFVRAYTGYETPVTVDIHVNFLRAVHRDDKAVIKAKITHTGSRIINVVSELYAKDKLCATADAIFYKVG